EAIPNWRQQAEAARPWDGRATWKIDLRDAIAKSGRPNRRGSAAARRGARGRTAPLATRAAGRPSSATRAAPCEFAERAPRTVRSVKPAPERGPPIRRQ